MKITDYALETEHGLVHVSKSEFEDVQARYTGAYGNDFRFNKEGDEFVFRHEDQGSLRVGSAYIYHKAVRPVTLTPFEIELQKLARAQNIKGILDLVQTLI